MAQRKSTPIIVVGGAVFVIGAALAYFALRGTSHQTARPPVAPPTTTSTTAQGAVVVSPPPSSASAAAAAANFSFTIPPGKNAVAVTAAFVPGLAGFVQKDALVNVFANVTKAKVAGAGPPSTKLVATNAQVLAVLTPPPSLTATGTVTFLLALDPATAEQVIFFQTYESLYFTLVPKGSAPAATPGRDYQNAA